MLENIGDLHPRPQLTRTRWVDLSGTWSFAYDDQDRGLSGKWQERDDVFKHTITVPFPPESSASGIGDPDFHPVVWYRRSFQSPARPGERFSTPGRSLVVADQVLRSEGGFASGLPGARLAAGALERRLLRHDLRAERVDQVRTRADDSRGPDPLGRHRNLADLVRVHGWRSPIRRESCEGSASRTRLNAGTAR